MNILEKIELHDALDQNLWDDNKLKKSIRIKLLKIAKDFVDTIKETGINLVIDDIIFTGSAASFNYTENSDIDLHIVVDFKLIDKNIKFIELAFDALAKVWKMNHIITIKGYPIEVFVQNIDTPPQATAGVYSITNNDWVEIPEKLKPETEITDENVKKIVKQYMEKIDALEISFTLSKDDQKTVGQIHDKAKELKDEIKDQRNLKSKKDIFGIGNLVFKELRNNGWTGKLIDLIHKSYDAIYIEENVENIDTPQNLDECIIDEIQKSVDKEKLTQGQIDYYRTVLRQNESQNQYELSILDTVEIKQRGYASFRQKEVILKAVNGLKHISYHTKN